MSNLKQEKYICSNCGFELVIHSDISQKVNDKCMNCGTKFKKGKSDDKSI